ncbi:MAG: DUF2066 domain-containing protein [Dokdonella sp.]
MAAKALNYCFLLLLVVLASGSPAHAASTYTGDAPVLNQGEEERAKGLQVALAQVVVQLTGDAAAPTQPKVDRAISRVSQKPLQFQYRTDSDGSTRLVAQFDANSVNHLLRENGLTPPDGGGETLDWTPSSATVLVEGVRSATDYARLIRFLTTLELVRSVAPERAEGETVRMHLELAADLPRFLDAIGNSSLLRVVKATAGDGVDATLGFAR